MVDIWLINVYLLQERRENQFVPGVGYCYGHTEYLAEPDIRLTRFLFIHCQKESKPNILQSQIFGTRIFRNVPIKHYIHVKGILCLDLLEF